MKTQQHLTPQQVEELRELGVQFKETHIVWARCITNVYGQDVSSTTTLRQMVSDEVVKFKGGWEVVPAPSLQEVMEKLPDMHFVKGNPAWFKITKFAGIWSIGYRYADKPDGRFFRNTNPLLGAFELLKWVAKKHPKTLTNKTE